MHYVKLLVVVLLAGCLGGVLGTWWSEEQDEAAESDTRQGLGRNPQDMAVLLAAHRDPAMLAAQVAPLKEHGEDRKRESVVASSHR